MDQIIGESLYPNHPFHSSHNDQQEARLIPDGGVGTASNWGRSQTWTNVQVCV